MFPKRHYLALSSAALVGLCALVMAWAPVQQERTDGATRADKQSKPGNPWVCEPLLIWDVSGEVATGFQHKNLTVYNNGMVSLAQFSPRGTDSVNESKMIHKSIAKMLSDQLIELGAMQIPDQPEISMDVPLASVTVFQGETDAVAHTFNYWMPTEGTPYAAVHDKIQSFLLQEFQQ